MFTVHRMPRINRGLLPQNIVYTVSNRADKKAKLDILKNISGFFNQAQMTAVMGPSGSGKSTLLDLLAGRKNQGEPHCQTVPVSMARCGP